MEPLRQVCTCVVFINLYHNYHKLQIVVINKGRLGTVSTINHI